MSSPFIIAPSILSADFACLGEEVTAVLKAGADWVHIDVMDNHYVPNLTVGPLVCQALRNYGVTAPLDVHLMIEPVDALIPAFAKSGATYITVHPEATTHLDRTLQLIIDSGCKAGLVFNPTTPLHYLDYCLNKLDSIMLMSVNPGFAGQTFIPSTLEKLSQVRRLINAGKPSVRLAVDGGINIQNIATIAEAGANTFIAGAAIFGSLDYAATIKKMRDALSQVA
jgi:ribulose-phosphate 3-epimerase